MLTSTTWAEYNNLSVALKICLNLSELKLTGKVINTSPPTSTPLFLQIILDTRDLKLLEQFNNY